MPSFSETSKSKLETAEKDLQTVFNEVIKHFDCTVIYGHRTPEEQFELFKKGRKQRDDGTWAVIGHVVTYLDGYDKKSKHNECPSKAVDVIPYPIEWSNVNRMRVFAGFVLGIATMLKAQGKIKNDIVWGGDWDSDTVLKDQRFNDFPHFQIK
jgi:peptidoglycan L-alanyl-D-glutamate endopeptidase CwlK